MYNDEDLFEIREIIFIYTRDEHLRLLRLDSSSKELSSEEKQLLEIFAILQLAQSNYLKREEFFDLLKGLFQNSISVESFQWQWLQLEKKIREKTLTKLKEYDLNDISINSTDFRCRILDIAKKCGPIEYDSFIEMDPSENKTTAREIFINFRKSKSKEEVNSFLNICKEVSEQLKEINGPDRY